MSSAWSQKIFLRKIAPNAIFCGTGLTLIIVLLIVPNVLAGEIFEIPQISLKVDHQNLASLLIVTLIFFLTSLYNMKIEKNGRFKSRGYNFFILFLLCCTLGLLFSYDLFNIYFFSELLFGNSIILVTYTRGKSPTEAALKYAIAMIVSSFFLFLGLSVIITLTGTSNLLTIANNVAAKTSLIENPPLLMLAVACFIIAFSTKIGLFPFHGWLPDVYVASNPVIVSFFGGKTIALFLTLYNIISPLYSIYPSATFLFLMGGIGLISLLFGALFAYSQKDFMRMLAYCQINIFGLVFFILGLSLLPSISSISISVGIYYLLNSTLMKTGLFLSAGSVFFKSKIRNMDSLGGLFGKMNKTGVSYIICALSLIGVPPLSGFFAKWYLYNAVYNHLFDLGGIFLAMLILILLACISLLEIVFLLRSFHRIFLGQSVDNLDRMSEIHTATWFPTIILAAMGILLGFFPHLLYSLIGAG